MTSDTDTDTDTAGTAGAARSELSYEQARGELVRVVQQLETGGATLEESLALWERGEELARICREWLEGARARLDAVLEAEAAAEEEGEAESDSVADDDDPTA
ncbi:MAG: exodeoxyribonuclease VII small subunit [Streptomyces sp.]|uniref:exodeoxyribonuclease VII small subunit n=1 Tax=Streptomyces sp. TaxID=1931 RepID=UPI003D6B1136